MQAAPGTGIVSSIVLESADLDEVDIVVLGGNTTSLETNYYGKGSSNVLSYVAADSPQTKFHTYSLDWTSSSLVWSIDGTIVRTLAYSDADGGDSFPQTPMFLKLGSWDGGKPGGQPGTIAWAGGLTDFTDAPFLMYIQSVTVSCVIKYCACDKADMMCEDHQLQSGQFLQLDRQDRQLYLHRRLQQLK